MKEKIKNWVGQHKTLSEIFRFLIVGGLATIVDMFFMGVVLYIFQPSLYPHFYNVFFGGYTPSQISTIVGTGVGFVLGLIFNYIFSIIFVFEQKGNSKTKKGFLLFAILSAGGLVIHIIGMHVGFSLLGINEWIVKIVLTIVVLVYNYITRKLLIFKNKGEKLSEQE